MHHNLFSHSFIYKAYLSKQMFWWRMVADHGTRQLLKYWSWESKDSGVGMSRLQHIAITWEKWCKGYHPINVWSRQMHWLCGKTVCSTGILASWVWHTWESILGPGPWKASDLHCCKEYPGGSCQRPIGAGAVDPKGGMMLGNVHPRNDKLRKHWRLHRV